MSQSAGAAILILRALAAGKVSPTAAHVMRGAADLIRDQAAEIAAHGWRPISTAPSPACHARTHGLTLDDDKLVWFEDGLPVWWRPLPADPSC